MAIHSFQELQDLLQNVNKDFIYELSQKTSKFIIESIKFLNL